MEVFLMRLWVMLTGLYALIYQNGFVGFAVAMVIGLWLIRYGAKLTGSQATVTGTVRNGELVNGVYHPAILGTANTFVGKMMGTLAKLIGGVLLVEALIVLPNLLMTMK
jgi:hypothetical protein